MNILKQLKYINSTSFRGWPQRTAAFLNHPGWKSSQLHLMRLKSNDSEVPPSNSDYGRQLGGYEYRDNYVDCFRSKWRTPLSEREGYWKSKLGTFCNKRFAAGLTKYNPNNIKYFDFKSWWNCAAIEKLMYEQRFIKERLDILGFELTAAHFVIYRGGAIKFSGNSDWYRDDKTKREYDEGLPNQYTPGYVVEAIDLSGTKILYEGLVNICGLKELKWLSLAACPLFNSFYLDRISGEYKDTLEYLDLSHTNISHHGLYALYRFQKLKNLKLEGIFVTPELLLFCIDLKKCIPDLVIEGISFDKLDEEPESNNLVLGLKNDLNV